MKDANVRMVASVEDRQPRLGRISREVFLESYIYQVNLHHLNYLSVYENLCSPRHEIAPRLLAETFTAFTIPFHRFRAPSTSLRSFTARHATMQSQRLPQLPAVLKQRLLVELYL